MTGGRKKDVIIKQCTKDVAGVELPIENEYRIYADLGLKETIANVEGVLHCFAAIMPYSVTIDPRYDAVHVLKEIEAAILCK